MLGMSSETDFLPRPPSTRIESVAALDAPPPTTTISRTGHFANELPVEVMDSVHWKGTDADRFFTVDEPTFERFQAIVAGGNDIGTKVCDFIRQIGAADEAGRIIRDEQGNVAYRPVDHIEAARWFSRLGTPGKAGAIFLWTDTFNVSQSMGEKMRGSRRRLG